MKSFQQPIGGFQVVTLLMVWPRSTDMTTVTQKFDVCLYEKSIC